MAETHPEKRLIGYARVSTYWQTLDAQLDQLRAGGCSSRNIYREKVTGARADRRELNRMLAKLVSGDVVTVTRFFKPEPERYLIRLARGLNGARRPTHTPPARTGSGRRGISEAWVGWRASSR